MAFIELKDVTKIYTVGEIETYALNKVNLSIESGEMVVVLGPSGSGKSTLLNILSSLLKPTNGNVVFQSKDLYSLKQNELLKIRRDDFGIVFQAHYLFRGFSALENLNIATLLSHQDIDYKLLDDLNISHVLNQGVGELSGGQQQRLSIARILMKKPKIIFADEPTGNLDPETSNDIMTLLKNLAEENHCAVVMATHDYHMIQNYPGEAIRCENGQVTVLDTAELFE